MRNMSTGRSFNGRPRREHWQSEQDMTAVFAVMAAIAVIFSGIKYEITRRALINSLPPQFQGYGESRYAVDVYALEPSTPLPLQAEHMKALWGGCAALLCAALSFLAAGNPPFGGLVLIGFVIAVVSTIRSLRRYRENCKRAEGQQSREMR
jgi:hypothetical protein